MPIPTFESLQSKALELGWDDVGITAAKIPEEDIQFYLDWLSKGLHGSLGYMENRLRTDPETLFPGAKSAIIFVSYYKQEKIPFPQKGGLIASYARGRDYHHIHRKRLKAFIRWLENEIGESGIAKGFSDSTPILEKALAVQAGLGWFGKNTLLIHRRFGTFTLLSGVLTTIPFETPVIPLRLPRCGSCTRCMDACPTQALINPYTLDAARCLSYHLIESKNPIPQSIQEKNPGYIFGCDICQDVCPHNSRKSASDHEEFSPARGMGISLTLDAIHHLEEHPEELFGTPLQRKGVGGLKENLMTLKNT